MQVRTVFASVLLGLFLVSGAAPAQALPPLEQDPRVAREFFAVAVGDAIRRNCPDIAPRLLRLIYRQNALKRYALSLGYSGSDIEDLLDDPAAKARLEARRDAYLASQGVTEDDSESYCRLGRAEIEKNTFTGWLLRAN